MSVDKLGKKQSSTNSDWVAAWRNIQREPDKTAARVLVRKASDTITSLSKDSSIAYGWSGGKDSIALQIVMQEAGRGLPFIVWADQALEYPDLIEWVAGNKPEGLHELVRKNVNLDWLRKNPQMLFPETSTDRGRWFQIVQHAGQKSYLKEKNISHFITGRRKADGNYVGKETPYGHAYTDSTGVTKMSPLADWSHEELLNVIASYEFTLPPIYDYPRGWVLGTGPWPSRIRLDRIDTSWAELEQCDSSLAYYKNLIGMTE